MSTNLIMGQAGQLSFGAAAFAGIGGYTTALTTARLNWPPLAGLALGIVLAVAVALVVGKPVLRLKLYFLAMATMALVTIFTVVVTMARSVTFGPSGIPGIPELGVGSVLVDGFRAQYYFVWIIVLASAPLLRTGLAIPCRSSPSCFVHERNGGFHARHRHCKLEAAHIRGQRRLGGTSRRTICLLPDILYAFGLRAQRFHHGCDHGPDRWHG